MTIKKNSHIFLFDESGPKLMCPKCRQLITPSDVEMFYACPYCNVAIRSDSELDDFTISPLVKHWTTRCLSPNSGIIGGR